MLAHLSLYKSQDNVSKAPNEWNYRTQLEVFVSMTFSMVFCYENCSVLLWEKINFVMAGKIFCKFEFKGNLLEQCKV